jgi:hypothetical protein
MIEVNMKWKCPRCGKWHWLIDGSYLAAECGDKDFDDDDCFYLSAKTLKTMLKRFDRMGIKYEYSKKKKS